MRIRNLLSILSLSLVASIGAFYGLTKNNEVKLVKAEEVAKFCIRNGDEREMYYNDETFEWFIQDVELDAQQEFVVEYNSNTYGHDCFDYEAIQNAFYEGEDNYVGVSLKETYSIYFYFDEEGAHIKPANPFLEAEKWADETFFEFIKCSEDYSDAPGGWEYCANSFRDSLTDEAKDLFIEAVASVDVGASSIQRAAFIHDLCVSKYVECYVFMQRDDGGSRSSLITRANSNNVEFNSVALIITVASVTSITLLLTLLVIKKHKK